MQLHLGIGNLLPPPLPLSTHPLKTHTHKSTAVEIEHTEELSEMQNPISI